MKEAVANLYPPTLSLSVAFFTFLICYILTNSLIISVTLSIFIGILTYFKSRRISENLLTK